MVCIDRHVVKVELLTKEHCTLLQPPGPASSVTGKGNKLSKPPSCCAKLVVP